MENLFADLEWDVGSAREEPLVAGQPLRLAAGSTMLVSVLAGAVEVPRSIPGCSVTPDGAVMRPTTRIERGGVLLSVGRDAVTIRAQLETEVRVITLLPTAVSTFRLEAVPDLVSVTDLGATEPAAAALTPYVGHAGATDEHCTTARRVCRLMATTLVLGVLRAWAAAGCAPPGWPSRTADQHLARALDAIHDEPGRRWTVEQLAAAATMSRSAFAERFRAETGASPLGYVTEVRMARARSLLADGALVTDVARRLGYGSDDGFSRAFRRHHEGVSPSVWRATLGDRVVVG